MIIEINSLETLSTVGISASSISGDLKPQSAATLLSTTASSATNTGNIYIANKNIDLAQSYIQTMSDQELEELLIKIDNKIKYLKSGNIEKKESHTLKKTKRNI